MKYGLPFVSQKIFVALGSDLSRISDHDNIRRPQHFPKPHELSAAVSEHVIAELLKKIPRAHCRERVVDTACPQAPGGMDDATEPHLAGALARKRDIDEYLSYDQQG